MTEPRIAPAACREGVDFVAARHYLSRFDFTGLFIEVLNWNRPPNARQNTIKVERSSWQWSWLAEMEGVAVVRMHCQGQLPDRRMRRKLHKSFQRLHHEHLLVFVDDAAECKRSLWSWQKSHQFLREHYFSSNQPGDLRESKNGFLEKNIAALGPFHWGFEFNGIMNEKRGFDVILANPPWEILKPNAKEFFGDYAKEISKKKITAREFKESQEKLLGDKEIEKAWFSYQSSYPLQSTWFRSAEQFGNQSSSITDEETGKEKKTGSDINLYKLFLEQSYNLLHPEGTCGIVLPAGIYSDLGAKGLRKMLFEIQSGKCLRLR